MRRLPAGAWVCAICCFLSSACWAIIMPPFEVEDEPDHVAYVQNLAETGRLPDPAAPGAYSPEESRILLDLSHFEVRRNPAHQTISTPRQQQQLGRDLSAGLSVFNDGGAGVAASEPPLYYAIETLPYLLGSDSNLLVRLELMRLLSALMAGVAALFAYLFIREALPGVPWTWVPGGLAAALAPALGARAGGVTPDALLIAICSALLYCLARGFRRDLSIRLACAIGALTAAGLLTKLNFLGLIPGLGLGVLLLTWRTGRTSPRVALWCLALVLGIAVSPIVLNVLVGFGGRQLGLGIVHSGLRASANHGSILRELSYIWQLYLPALPGMHRDFPGILTTRELWFDAGVGLYGWHDTVFPNWVDDLALIPAGLLLLLAGRALFQSRIALRSRLTEIIVYLTMGAGLLVLVGAASYVEYPLFLTTYVNPRYLLPMLPLWGAGLALAARGGGRRGGPIVAVALVVLVFAHDLFSQLLVISRYY